MNTRDLGGMGRGLITHLCGIAAHIWGRIATASPLLFLALVIGLTSCKDSEAPAQGGTGSTLQSERSPSDRTATPASAPLAQPEYGQTGLATASRIITNPPGVATISHNETARKPSPNNFDQALAERVRVALSTGTTGTTGIYADESLLDIGVTATNGVVTLTGTVGSQSARQAMEERAKSIEEVKAVNNQLRISTEKANEGRIPGVPAGRGERDVVPQNPGRR